MRTFPDADPGTPDIRGPWRYLLWMATSHIGPLWIVALGAVYLVGRFIYLRSYVQAPEKRSLGFGLSALPILILLGVDLVGSLLRLIRP